ncbi:phage tail protein [Bacteroides ihuae]|uniref:phage tail protein n=1 Tax=Bacteroides ihuae TaxID=1852362 RepID=UPI0008D9BE4A|nr:tail fiber protein [Bacteroides ihuae]
MDSFIGEIRAFPYNFVPQGWYACYGQPLAINQYQALFSIIGWTYGGDYRNYFNLPNLQAAALVGVGTNNQYGSTYLPNHRYGSESITLTDANLPVHIHNFIGKGGADAARTSVPSTTGDSYLSNVSYKRASDTKALVALAYRDVSKSPVTLHPATIANCEYGSNIIAPHENRSPFLAIRYCICVSDADYPQRPQ